MRTSRKSHWDKVYKTRGVEDVSWFQEHPEPSLGLIMQYGEEARRGIIDVGAGASRLVDSLLAAGLSDVSLLDISETALQRTAERLAAQGRTADLIVADVTRFQPGRYWGIWHDRAVFHFLTSAEDQEAYIQALEAGTRPGSVIIMGTFALEGPEKCSGLPVQRYSPETLQARLGGHFELIASRGHVHLTPAGAEQRFSFAVFRRVPAGL